MTTASMNIHGVTSIKVMRQLVGEDGPIAVMFETVKILIDDEVDITLFCGQTLPTITVDETIKETIKKSVNVG